MNNLQSVYPKQQMADISTSYCFICLLHLANEKGLVIQNEEGTYLCLERLSERAQILIFETGFQELTIRRDPTAEITGEGE